MDIIYSNEYITTTSSNHIKYYYYDRKIYPESEYLKMMDERRRKDSDEILKLFDELIDELCIIIK